MEQYNKLNIAYNEGKKVWDAYYNAKQEKPIGYHYTPNETWAILPCKPGRVYHRKDPNPPTELSQEDIDDALQFMGYKPDPDMYVQAFFKKLDIEERLEMYGKRVQLGCIDTPISTSSGKTCIFRRYEPLICGSGC